MQKNLTVVLLSIAALPNAAALAQAEQGAGFLDQVAGKAFKSPWGGAKVTINEKGEWRLEAPGGDVTYIARWRRWLSLLGYGGDR